MGDLANSICHELSHASVFRSVDQSFNDFGRHLQQRAPQAHLALNSVRSIAQPVGLDELMAITELWVDTALRLGDKSLRMMERIVRAQTRRTGMQAA